MPGVFQATQWKVKLWWASPSLGRKRDGDVVEGKEVEGRREGNLARTRGKRNAQQLVSHHLPLLGDQQKRR